MKQLWNELANTGTTVIGKDSMIDGNVWLTDRVPPHSKVISPDIEMR